MLFHKPTISHHDEMSKLLRYHLQLAEKRKTRLLLPAPGGEYRAAEGKHFHAMPELFIQVAGVSVMTFPNEETVSKPGDVLVVPKGVPHREKAFDGKWPFRNLVVAYSRNHINTHFGMLVSGRTGIRTTDCQTFQTNAGWRISEHLQDLAEAWFEDSTHREGIIWGSLVTNLSKLLDIVTGKGDPIQSYSQKVLLCKRLIRLHLSNQDLSVQWLAEQIGCSADYLSHLYSQETGETLIARLNTERLSLARDLLETTDLNVSEVARTCGFRDPGYFTRLFRKHYNSPPSELTRKTLRLYR